MKTSLFTILLLLSVMSCTRQTTNNDLDVPGVTNPEILLNGTWKFSMTPPEKFWENSADFQNWADIQVPGECQMQGFAIKHDECYVYKHEFLIPNDFEGQHIQLSFYGVYSYAKVWVNGNFVREHFGGFTKWDCKIDEFVTPGEKAILTLEIADRIDEISYGSGYAKHQIGGILRDVKLTALPKQNFKKLYFETDLDELYRDAELNVFYELQQNTPAKMQVELLDAENKTVNIIKIDVNGLSGQISIPVNNPKKWDAEHPNLYTVKTTLIENGATILKTSEKIGFREIETKGNVLLVNGKPVKLRGACRHDIHPTLGRMTTSEYDLKDVLLAKECNMNFIRTSHYPPSEKFLEYCDEYGIYVEAESDVCFVGMHRTEAYQEMSYTADDPEFTDRYLSRLEEMILNHRNHPSVIIWSIGNENKFGSNFVKSYNKLKENDTTRPVIFSYPGLVPDSLEIYDIVSMHYPSWRGDLNQYGVRTEGFESEDKPMLFDEWAHVPCYNNFELKYDPNVRSFWGQSLDSMWTYLFDTKGGLGGAIWCMIDETFMLPEGLDGFNQWWGVIDSRISPPVLLEPTVGYGEWGIVDTWRRKKPEFWGTKKAYSPTKIYTKQINNFEIGESLIIPVHNRFDHTNFNELKIAWKYGEESGELEKVNLEPHKRGELIIPANKWDSSMKLNIKFYQNDYSLIDEYNIQLGDKIIKLPTCENGKIKVTELENKVSISGKQFSLDIDKASGLLENIKANDEIIVVSGPYINLMFPGKKLSHSMDDYAQNWKLKDFQFDVVDGIAAITINGSYDSISAEFAISIDENGVFDIGFKIKNAPTNKYVQEAGIKFILGDAFEKLAWERNGYFTAYPEDDLGKLNGEVSLFERPEMVYREKPSHNWIMDTKNYFYTGLEEEMPYTNITRSLKENIYKYALEKNNSKVEVVSDGTQACRFDKINNNNTLIINNLWNYNSIGWGNYNKQTKLDNELEGRTVMLIK